MTKANTPAGTLQRTCCILHLLGLFELADGIPGPSALLTPHCATGWVLSPLPSHPSGLHQPQALCKVEPSVLKGQLHSLPVLANQC